MKGLLSMKHNLDSAASIKILANIIVGEPGSYRNDLEVN